MNPCLIELFSVQEKRDRFAKGLPTAFDKVRQQVQQRNPAVGILRKHVIIGFFVSEFGPNNVDVPDLGNQRSGTLLLCGHKLSIKTRTNDSAIKILWTSDNEKVQKELESYKPESDILLINIHWKQRRNSVFYFPLTAQQSVMEKIGRSKYLKSESGTNNRGIDITKEALANLEIHKQSLAICVDWTPNATEYPKPWAEWVNYWIDR